MKFWGKPRPAIPTTMTISEANEIVRRMIAILTDETRHTSQCQPSALNGHSLFDVITALKLNIANDYLLLAEHPDFEARFSSLIEAYDGSRFSIVRAFRDYHLESPLDERFFGVLEIDGGLDSIFDNCGACWQFGDFCKTVGFNNNLFWQNVYTELKLQYTPKSPQLNIPQL